MEKHVVSLELSKRLKALGVKQESEFYWVKAENDAFFHLSRWKNQKEFDDDGDEVFDELGISSYLEIDVETAVEFYSAFLASEITDYIYKHTKIDFWIYHNAGLYMVQDGQHSNEFEHESIAECFGLWLEYLIQNKMI